MKYFFLLVAVLIVIGFVFASAATNESMQINNMHNEAEALGVCKKFCSEAEEMGPLQGISSYCTVAFYLAAGNMQEDGLAAGNNSGRKPKWYCLPLKETELIRSLNYTCNVDCQYKF